MEALVYTTTFAGVKKSQTVKRHAFKDAGRVENEVINLYPNAEFQALDGFGGAFTDSSGYVFSLMDEKNQKALIDAYFGENGANYTIGRVHLDSCDFSCEHFEAIKPNDETLDSFSLARPVKYVKPLLDAAQTALKKPVDLLVSIWSPPAFMKTTGKRNGGGELLPKWEPLYAAYISRYIKELRALGFNITCMTTQNEPLATQTWDSCIFSAEREKAFIRDRLYPQLEKDGLTDVGIFIWDHNKERAYERAAATIDDVTAPYIKGIGFHWYSGDHFEALELLSRRFPNVKLALTEACLEYSLYGNEAQTLSSARKYAHEIIGDLNNGASAIYDWNILLDRQGGPNHVQNFCDAPFMYDEKTKTLIERPSFEYINHFSKYIAPKARRIGLSRYTSDVEATAFRNPNGAITVVLLNNADKPRPAVLRAEGQAAEIELPAGAIATAVIN